MSRFGTGGHGVSVFDTFESLCDSSRCAGLDGSHIFYFDSNHLSISGSRKVLDDFARRYYPAAGTAAAGGGDPVRR
jgi:hypothetical protein